MIPGEVNTETYRLCQHSLIIAYYLKHLIFLKRPFLVNCRRVANKSRHFYFKPRENYLSQKFTFRRWAVLFLFYYNCLQSLKTWLWSQFNFNFHIKDFSTLLLKPCS